MAKFVCLKDLAQALGLSTKSVKRWSKRVGVPPTIGGYGPHRWSQEDAQRLIKALQDYGRAHPRKDPRPTA